MIDYEDPEYLAYCAEVEAEIAAEIGPYDPVRMRFGYINFVSKSKGKNRKRKFWEEIELVYDKHTRKHTTFDNYPFDRISSEVLPYIGRTEVTNILMDRVRELNNT